MEGDVFGLGFTSPLCSSCGCLEMAMGPLPGAWLSLGWTRGAMEPRAMLGVAKVSSLLE